MPIPAPELWANQPTPPPFACKAFPAGACLRWGTTTLTYTSDDAQTLSATVGGGGVASVTLNFTTSTTRFADPNPTNANGDSDGDGITEAEEAQMGVAFGGIGDPR